MVGHGEGGCVSEGLLRIGEVATGAGVSTRTVDFYTSIGLIEPASRTGGNFRLYAADTVERVLTIRRLEAQGVRLDDIAQALSDGASRDGVAALMEQLDRDVQLLRDLADTTGLDVAGLLAAVTSRAHSLITLAIEIAQSMPPPL
jgi:MerR family copper efflux transcriptional regulator